MAAVKPVSPLGQAKDVLGLSCRCQDRLRRQYFQTDIDGEESRVLWTQLSRRTLILYVGYQVELAIQANEPWTE